MLSTADKIGIARALTAFLRGYPQSDEEPFSDWMKRARQSENAICHFWEPIIVSTLNDCFERCSTRYAGQVFHELFLKSSDGGRQGIPTQPLSVFYDAFAQLAVRQGTELHLRSSVDRIEQRPDGTWQATTSTGSLHRAQKLLLALPFEQTGRLLKTLPEGTLQCDEIVAGLQHFVSAPFTTIHLWFDRPVTELDQAALLDTKIQWMFNKSRIRREEPGQSQQSHYLELVIAASFEELERTRESILSGAMEELARFFPAAREAKLIKSGVLKEARATFSVIPGLERYRPAPAAPGGGLYLAGDWTRTGWPSTMEGAARSGRLAAQAIVPGSIFLTPDLPATGLMRWLT
jgi:zeta-carotene desaturase